MMYLIELILSDYQIHGSSCCAWLVPPLFPSAQQRCQFLSPFQVCIFTLDKSGYQNPFRSMAPFCTAISIDPVPLPSIPCTCSPVKFRERLLSASARLETLKFPFWIQLLLSSSESRAI